MRTTAVLSASLRRVSTCLALTLLVMGCRRAQPQETCTNSAGCTAGSGSAGLGIATAVAAAGMPSFDRATDSAPPAAAGASGSSSSQTMSLQSVAGSQAAAAGVAGASSQGASGMGLASAGMMANGAGAAGGSGSNTDAQGVPLAKPGDSKTQSHDYLNLGDFRLLVNKWGSDELGCDTMMKVFVNADKTFGWSFDRGSCGGNKQKPDYPEIEFGIHPFGSDGSSGTTPPFSSTLVVPIQIKDITSASVLVEGLNATIQKASTWNVDVEFWLSERNPATDPNPGVYAELIAFWGWQDSWDCDQSGSVTAGDKTYNLCHQSDNWGEGWRYYQFRASDGPANTYSGRVDVKAFIDWLVSKHGFSTQLWLTRIEVGSEIDDNTAGSVTLENLSFEVNGQSKSAQLGQ